MPSSKCPDPAESFEYDEHGCLVEFTPEAFDHFMLGQAMPARVNEVREVLQRLKGRFQGPNADPCIEHEQKGIRQVLARSEERLRAPITQLSLMLMSSRFNRIVERFNEARAQERQSATWLGF